MKNVAVVLVTDGMKLAPAGPNFLEARDAILQADRVDNGGVNLRQLWAAFAKRGMGFSATSPSSTMTSGVREAYDLPDDLLIQPNSGLMFRGPVGGPFLPLAPTYVLANQGANPLLWRAAADQPWLTLTPASGTLAAAGPSVTLTVALAPEVEAIPAGLYTNTIRFTNLTSGMTQQRQVVLGDGYPDYFTELFSANDFDLAYQTLTFTPDGSSQFYGVSVQPATRFPADPAGGTALALSDDSYAQVMLSGTHSVAVYGRRTNVFFVGSNGYLTLDSGDLADSDSLAKHFNRPRVSALFDDLDPEDAGTVSWKELGDEAVVTYQDVTECDIANQNSFQIELFYDGMIRITYLQIEARSALVGLSAGNGIPVGFLESDFSYYGEVSGGRPQQPDITTQPVSQTVAAGPTVFFSVRTTGTSPLSHQWRSSCGPLADATNLVLALPSVATNQSGCAYWVEVANAYGAVTSTWAVLTVTNIPGAPSITAQPQDQVAAYLGSAVLQVAAIGQSALSYQWFRGGSGDTAQPLAGATGLTVVTPPVSAPAWFWVRVRNAVGFADSRSARVSMPAPRGWDLRGMGQNSYGQLGDGTTNDRITPVPVASGVAQVAAGAYHSLFVKTDGTLWAMGYNYFGQLGDGTTTNRTTPVLVAGSVAQAAAGGAHSLFVKTDGALWATGADIFGQLGDATATTRSLPVLVTNAVAGAAAHGDFSLFLEFPNGLMPPVIAIQPQSRTNLVGTVTTLPWKGARASPTSSSLVKGP